MKLLTIFLMTSLVFVANAKEQKSHREHGAHAHGAGSLGMAFEGTTGRIDFKMPGESVIGFEYVAKSAKDKSKRDAALLILEKSIAEMIVFESSLNCRFTKEKIEIIAESAKHSSVAASFKIDCAKSPVGTEIVFNFQKQFPKIKDLDVEVVADTVQKSVEVKKNNTKLLLK